MILPRGYRKAFTLVELIAVLIIIGILAAVAVPKFLELAEDARRGAAQTGINECKATLSVAYAQAYLENEGLDPTIVEVMDAAGLPNGGSTDFGDIEVATVRAGDIVTITATSVENITVTGVVDTWTKPTL